jgi:hypothetical protein
MFVLGRFLRNSKAIITYPFWALFGRPAPDNHIFKRIRIRNIGARFECETFIETGTFYGQMIDALKDYFQKIMSVELSEPLYHLNQSSFSAYPQVRIYLGDSSTRLQEMLRDARGRILFWLDGHYSGEGTACGEQVSPILGELNIINKLFRCDHCILIDDLRLFTGEDGYPTLETTKAKLLEINPNYQITIDHDCIVALPDK